MYERRLKIFFGLLIAMTLAILLRAAHVQIASSEDLRQRAEESLQRTQYLDTTRGSIRDARGRVLATDAPCMVAAVDYRAIERNPEWMKAQAVSRLGLEYRRAGKDARAQLLKEELLRLNSNLDAMWKTLAELSGKPLEEIEEIQMSIRRRVEQQRRYLWYSRFKDALRRQPTEEVERWYEKWLSSGERLPEVDSFVIEVADQTEAHPILKGITTETHNWLRKQLDRFPGLVLRPSKQRIYPLGEVACHLLGRMAMVDREDIRNDPNIEDDLRHYRFADQVGRGGIEELCEQALRGARGKIVRASGENRIVEEVQPVGGRDVRITIDADLQERIEQAFHKVELREKDPEPPHEMFGAAVVIDVPTGQVRALVSYPTYDLNRLDELYAQLLHDDFRRPLINRATQMPLEPGSTVKPIVGLAAITQGVWGVDQRVECSGYLVINGKRWTNGKCWTVSVARDAKVDESATAFHRAPHVAPHPDGRLNYGEALERSCNVYFETLGHRLRIDGLARWYDAFGLGRKTGIGIAERVGRIPDPMDVPTTFRDSIACFSAIGQTQVAATPLQMANVAATIARNGIWMRPRLTVNNDDARPATRPVDEVPDRVDLRLSPAALVAAKQGMRQVVNGPAGTGKSIQRNDVQIAGKTGTAQAVALVQHDHTGRVVRDEKGQMKKYEPSIWPDRFKPEQAWYRADAAGRPHHAWFIGFAPYQNPKIAFAVMLEYGGSGGNAAGPLAKAVLEACVQTGYLPLEK